MTNKVCFSFPFIYAFDKLERDTFFLMSNICILFLGEAYEKFEEEIGTSERSCY